MPNRYKYDDIIKSNKQVMDKLKIIEISLNDIDDNFKNHDESTLGQYVQSLGITLVILATSFFFFAVIPTPWRSLVSGFLLLSLGFVFVVLAFPFAKYVKKKELEKKKK